MAKKTIHIKTLDSYCETHGIERIHFLKIDVEGHDLAVLRGTTHMLENGNIDMIQFEYGGCNLDARVYLLDIWELLTAYGFSMAKILPDGPRPIETYSQELENFRYSNYLASLKDSSAGS